MRCTTDDPTCGGPLDHDRTSDLIRRHGWTAVAVGAGPDTPSFCYTIGLTERGLPELVTFGLPPDVAHGFFVEVVPRLVEGTARHGAVVDGLAREGFLTAFASVPSGPACDGFLIQARRHYGHDVEVLQMVWPDRDGLFPWDEGFSSALSGIQDAIVPMRERPEPGIHVPRPD